MDGLGIIGISDGDLCVLKSERKDASREGYCLVGMLASIRVNSVQLVSLMVKLETSHSNYTGLLSYTNMPLLHKTVKA
jgi:hypothetical protein